MSKYIKREDAVFAACKVLDKFGGCKMGSLCPDVGCVEVRDIVDQYICEDVVERKRGKWILVKDWSNEVVECGEKYWVCSLCGCGSDSYDTTYHTSFCPNCGARMVEDDEA